MAADRTFVTELATGLGMSGDDDLASIIARRPTVMANPEWTTGNDSHSYGTRAPTPPTLTPASTTAVPSFFTAADALNGRLGFTTETNVPVTWRGQAAVATTSA